MPSIGAETPAASTVHRPGGEESNHPPRASPGVGSRLWRRIARVVGTTWLLVLLLAIWEWRFWSSPSLFVPRISEILSTIQEDFFSGSASDLFVTDDFHQHVVRSLWRAARAWAVALVFGIVVGVLLGSSKVLNEIAYPLVRFGMSIPSTALLPIALVLFGVTDNMTMFLIAFGSVWVILVNTVDGVRNLDETTLLTAKSLHLGPIRRLFQVVLPGASPQIMTGIRVSIGIVLILMTVSELFAASDGIGYYIVFSQRTFDFDRVWAGVFLVGFLGIAANGLFAVVESRVLRWHRAAREVYES